MALITNSNVLNTPFTPAAGAFTLACLSGTGVQVMRDIGSGYTEAGRIMGGKNLSATQDVATHQWMFVPLDMKATGVRADQ